MTKNEFDKMLRVAILEDRIKYGSGLISELEKLIPSFSDALHAFNKSRCEALNKIRIEELSCPPLTYEAIIERGGKIILPSNNEKSFWEQHRFSLAKDLLLMIMKEYKDISPAYSTEAKIKDAILIADKFITKFLKNNRQ